MQRQVITEHVCFEGAAVGTYSVERDAPIEIVNDRDVDWLYLPRVLLSFLGCAGGGFGRSRRTAWERGCIKFQDRTKS